MSPIADDLHDAPSVQTFQFVLLAVAVFDKKIHFPCFTIWEGKNSSKRSIFRRIKFYLVNLTDTYIEINSSQSRISASSCHALPADLSRPSSRARSSCGRGGFGTGKAAAAVVSGSAGEVDGRGWRLRVRPR